MLIVVGLPSVAAPPIPPSAAAPRDDGQWTMPAKNFASTRYTELNEINTQNAKQLRVEFTFSTGVVRVSVDAATGKETWRTKLGDINRGETITMPLSS